MRGPGGIRGRVGLVPKGSSVGAGAAYRLTNQGRAIAVSADRKNLSGIYPCILGNDRLNILSADIAICDRILQALGAYPARQSVSTARAYGGECCTVAGKR